MKGYPGAKSNSGIQQFFINNIPFHKAYAELFAGSARLFLAKRPAELNFLNDACKEVTDALERLVGAAGHSVDVSNDCAIECLKNWSWQSQDFIYLDPPYPRKARRTGSRKIYRIEMMEDSQHAYLLHAVRVVPAMVMISTKQNDLYDEMLHDWRKLTFDTVDHIGPVQEVIYMNYPPPLVLHQYDFLGEDFIDRQRIARKLQRFSDKLLRLPLHEKHVLIQAMVKNDCAAVQHFLSMVGLHA